MDIVEAVLSRKSIRGYKPAPVPKEVLREILDTAIHAPSVDNAQPWEITVITGKVLDNVKRAIAEKLNSRVVPKSEVLPRPSSGKYRRSQVELSLQIFKLMGIASEDKERRAEWSQRGFRFFEAPAVIILSFDKSIEESLAIFDLGVITQTICLTALNYGLGTCIEVQGVTFADILRRFTHMPESKRIVIAIAIGYPDWDFPANKLESRREPVEKIVNWCGFD